MMEESSLKRAVKEALADYRDEHGVGDFFALKDLLIEARHICDEQKLCYGDADHDAHEGYLEEKEGD